MFDIAPNEKLALIVSALSFAMLGVYKIYGIWLSTINETDFYTSSVPQEQKDAESWRIDYFIYNLWSLVLCLFLFAEVGIPLITYISELAKSVFPTMRNGSGKFAEVTFILFCVSTLLISFLMLGRMLCVPMLHFLVGMIERYHKQSVPGADQEHSESNQYSLDKISKNDTKHINTTNNQKERE